MSWLIDTSVWSLALRRDGEQAVPEVVVLRDALDDAVRAAARRVAAGSGADVEVMALEDAIARDAMAYLRPAVEVASLPVAAFVALGRRGGAPARASVVLPDALFGPEVAGLDLYSRRVVEA